MHNRRLLFIGRWRLYEKIRRLIFETVLEVVYVTSDSELNSNLPLIVDRVFERYVKCRVRRYNVVDDVDTVDLLAMLADMLSSLTACRDLVVGVDLGPDNSGIAIVHCGIPTLHAVLPTHLICRLVKLLLDSGLNVIVCVGVGARKAKPRDDLSMLILSKISQEVPLYVIDEREVKYRRTIFRSIREDLARRGDVTSHELDAVVYALSVDSAIRVRL